MSGSAKQRNFQHKLKIEETQSTDLSSFYRTSFLTALITAVNVLIVIAVGVVLKSPILVEPILPLVGFAVGISTGIIFLAKYRNEFMKFVLLGLGLEGVAVWILVNLVLKALSII